MAHYRALERAFRVLRALLHAQPPTVRLIDLANRVELDKGTLSRILADLEGEGLVQREIRTPATFSSGWDACSTGPRFCAVSTLAPGRFPC